MPPPIRSVSRPLIGITSGAETMRREQQGCGERRGAAVDHEVQRQHQQRAEPDRPDQQDRDRGGREAGGAKQPQVEQRPGRRSPEVP
jgi:hypothetical protein